MHPEQFSNPVGDDGNDTLKHMNEHHRDLAEWALSVIPDISPKKVLDVGCGGGMLISLLSERFTDTRLTGIDISVDAVEFTKRTNAGIIQDGRLDVIRGSVSELPFGDDTFDIVTAFETYFFWPDLENDIKEVFRVTKDNGLFIIVSETYPHPKFTERNERIIKEYRMNILENRKMAELLENAGFIVETAEVEDNNWIAFIGRK